MRLDNIFHLDHITLDFRSHHMAKFIMVLTKMHTHTHHGSLEDENMGGVSKMPSQHTTGTEMCVKPSKKKDEHCVFSRHKYFQEKEGNR